MNPMSWIPLKFNACVSRTEDIPFPFHYFQYPFIKFPVKNMANISPLGHFYRWSRSCIGIFMSDVSMEPAMRSWWFQPIWKIVVKLDHYTCNHHLVTVWSQQNPIHSRKNTDLFTTLLWYHVVFLLTPPKFAQKSRGFYIHRFSSGIKSTNRGLAFLWLRLLRGGSDFSGSRRSWHQATKKSRKLAIQCYADWLLQIAIRGYNTPYDTKDGINPSKTPKPYWIPTMNFRNWHLHNMTSQATT